MKNIICVKRKMLFFIIIIHIFFVNSSPILGVEKSEANYTIPIHEKNYFYLVPLIIVLILLVLIILIYIYRLIMENRKISKKENEIKNLSSKYEKALHSMILLLEKTNLNNKDHIKRVGFLSKLIADNLNLCYEIIEDIHKFAPLHDIGNISIQREISYKPNNLSEIEFSKIKKHVEIGYDIAKELNMGLIAENIIRYHHERYDGSGYPFGLKDDEIPIEAQIVGLADVYDSLRNEKPYRESKSHNETIEYIISEKNKKFNSIIVRAFIDCEDMIIKYYK